MLLLFSVFHGMNSLQCIPSFLLVKGFLLLLATMAIRSHPQAGHEAELFWKWQLTAGGVSLLRLGAHSWCCQTTAVQQVAAGILFKGLQADSSFAAEPHQRWLADARQVSRPYQLAVSSASGDTGTQMGTLGPSSDVGNLGHI